MCQKAACYTEDREVTCKKCNKVIAKGEPRHTFVSMASLGPLQNFHCKCLK